MLREFVALFSAAYIYIYYYPRQARRLCTFVFSAGVYVGSMANGGQLVFLKWNKNYLSLYKIFIQIMMASLKAGSHHSRSN